MAAYCTNYSQRHGFIGLDGGNKARLNKISFFLLKILGVVFVIICFCEFLVYYLVIMQCKWPNVKDAPGRDDASALKAIFLSDTHLLGEIRGHWFDKLRREWQMERSYQSAMWLLQPDIVFILGDLFDEGKWSHSKAWDDDVTRFRRMFRHPAHTELLVVVGNHDVGFHYEMTVHKLNRFEKAFNVTSGKVVSRKGINFILINSVALEGDKCVICRAAEKEIFDASHKLNCSRRRGDTNLMQSCRNVEPLPPSAPILLQHYPLYRKSDADCMGEDSVSAEEKDTLFQEKYDVLSQEASEKLLWLLQPRLILSGHTHSACEVYHKGVIPEISVPSFSWRNRNNPSFIVLQIREFLCSGFDAGLGPGPVKVQAPAVCSLAFRNLADNVLGTITAVDFTLGKCFLPTENTVLFIYSAAGIFLALYILLHLCAASGSLTFSKTKQKPV